MSPRKHMHLDDRCHDSSSGGRHTAETTDRPETKGNKQLHSNKTTNASNIVIAAFNESSKYFADNVQFNIFDKQDRQMGNQLDEQTQITS